MRMVLANAMPLGSHRDAGRPEAIYPVERLIDSVAVAMSIDCIGLRHRNFITQFPA